LINVTHIKMIHALLNLSVDIEGTLTTGSAHSSWGDKLVAVKAP